MIPVVDHIIEIEKSNHLYEMIDDKGVPVWDILRYDVIKVIEYKYNPNRTLLPKSSISKRILILLKAIRMVFPLLFLKKKRFLFYIQSRYKNEEGKPFDRIANDLIVRASPSDRLVFDSSGNESDIYNSYKLPIGFFYTKYRKIQFDRQIGNTIAKTINAGFNDNVISFTQLQVIYSQFYAQVRLFEWILRKAKPEKVFISYGRFKPLCFSAKKAGIPTWLMQHSLIEKDDATIAGTCPNKKYGINADTLLTFGPYWGDYLKHLMNVQVIGNRIMSKVGIVPQYDGTIVIASSLYQGPYLSTFFMDFASDHPEMSFIYKLHPGEAVYLKRYLNLFAKCPNVKVILNEMTMDELIQSCSLMVLVSSTTFYEALHLHKCVAVYAIPEFKSLTRFLLEIPNSYAFTTEKELDEIINNAKYDDSLAISFFEPFNDTLADQLMR